MAKVPAPPQKPPAVAGPPTIPSAAVVSNATAVADAGAVQNPAAVPNAAAAPHPVASPAADFLALLSPDRMVSPAAGAEHAKPIEKETEHLNVAVKAFQLLLDRARHNRDVSGQPASFQYTLWCMVLLIVLVTAVGVVLLNSAAQRQRDKLTSMTEPATTYKPDDEDDDEDNDYQVAVERHNSGRESTNSTTDVLDEDAGTGVDTYSTEKTIQGKEDAETTNDEP